MNYKNYHLTIGNDSNSYTFVYELEQHHPAQTWANLMESTTVDALKKGYNPWMGSMGSTSPEKRTAAVSRLIALISSLNQWVPEKIETQWDENDPQHCLNKLHVHFPEIVRVEKDPERLRQISEYNDVIHILEHLYKNQQHESLMLVVLPNFGRSVPINDDDYALFDPSVKFGEMVLHYPLVGREAFAMLKGNDYDCPVEQIRPQNIISPYHHLRFFDDPADTEMYRKRFKDFYERSTIKQKYKIDDPKLAFGFIKLGKLVSILDRSEILNIVRSCNKIISWKIT
jgi:hypothetical protein